jgi:hypothetical protein
METGMLDTNGLGGIKSIRARLLPRGSSQDLAVVGALATAFSQYFGRHLGDFACVVIVSGVLGCDCSHRRWHGRDYQHRKRPWPRILGMGIGLHHATRRLSRDVTDTGAALLDLPKRSFRMAANHRRISRFGVFRRWIRDHVSLRG